jgi:hypothetical protein
MKCHGCEQPEQDDNVHTCFYIDGVAGHNRVILCTECVSALVNFYATSEGEWPPPEMESFVNPSTRAEER